MKEKRRLELIDSSEMRTIEVISKWMDNRFLDPIIGFFIPGFGDVITTIVALPYLNFTLFKCRSLSLTIVVLCHFILDILVGLFPVIGDIVDACHKAYAKNARIIRNWVYGDSETIKHVRKMALWFLLLTVLLSYIVWKISHWVANLFSDCWEWITTYI